MIEALFDMSQIKAKSHIQGNVDESLIGVTFERAQDLYLNDVWGTAMYEDIQTKKQNGTLNSIETELLDKYALPFLAIAVEYELVYPLNMELRSQTFGLTQDSTIRPATLSELQAYRDSLRDKMMHYRRLMLDFICDNSASFPLFKGDGTYRGGNDYNINLYI